MINEGKPEAQKKRPPCEQCRPEMNESNQEAWQVFEMVASEKSGATAQGVKAACELLDVSDPAETYVKVMELSKQLQARSERAKPPREG